MMNLSISRLLPGFDSLRHYRRVDLPADLRAGLTVAAVALPISFANAQIAGFSPIVGLYSFLLPMILYVFLGTSRHLIIGPDAATAALVAASIAPLAQGDASLYLTLSIVLAMMVGVICLAASLLRLGGVADFLSRPILIGFLHGVALAIFIDQVPTLLGFKAESIDPIPAVIEIVSHFGRMSPWTVGTSLATGIVMIAASKWFPKLPAALVAMVAAAAAVAVFGLRGRGVETIGAMAGGLPHLRFDLFRPDLVKQLLGSAGGVAMVSYAGVILDARIFATRNGYDIDADREFAALGVSQLAAAVSGGFCIGSLDSGAALVDSSKGKTRLAGMISVVAMLVIMGLFLPLLAFVPKAALAVIVLDAAWAMTDLPYLRSLFRMSKVEFVVATVAFLGVLTLGAVDAILLAVVLALLRFVRITSRPPVETLGKLPGIRGYHSIQRHSAARGVPGLVIFRFNAPLIFFNAPYFKRKALESAETAGTELRWFVLDALPVSQIDVTGWHALTALMDELSARNVRLVIAGRRSQFGGFAANAEISTSKIQRRLFPTISSAVAQYRKLHPPPETSAADLSAPIA
jgi:high affinity sulfate transporter 1